MTRAVSLVIALACGVARADPDAPSADPAQSAAEQTPAAIDAEAACRALLIDSAVAQAATCYRALARDPTRPDDVRARAQATLELLEAWASGRAAQVAPVAPEPEPARISVSEVLSTSVREGLAEGVVASTVLGAVGGTTLMAAALAKARTDKITSTPLLLLAPAVGGIAGGALGYGALSTLDATPGDVALATSGGTLGFIAALPLQLLLFDDNNDVGAVPLRILTVAAGGAAGALAGGGIAALTEVTQGDVALAHSASLWTTVLMMQLLATRSNVELADGVLVLEGSLLIPYALVVAAHQHVEINRFATWLIEVGGVSGLLMAGAAVVVVHPGDVRPLFVTGTVAGVACGLAAAVLADTFLDQAEDGAAP